MGLGSSIFFHCSHRFFPWLLDFFFIFKHTSAYSRFCSSASSSLPSLEILVGKSFCILNSILPYEFHTWCQQNSCLTRLVINYTSQAPIEKGAKWAATSVSLRISVLVSLTKYKAIKWLHSFQWVNSVLKAKVYFFSLFLKSAYKALGFITAFSNTICVSLSSWLSYLPISLSPFFSPGPFSAFLPRVSFSPALPSPKRLFLSSLSPSRFHNLHPHSHALLYKRVHIKMYTLKRGSAHESKHDICLNLGHPTYFCIFLQISLFFIAQ